MVTEAAAPHAAMSVSTVTRVVFPETADTVSPRTSRSAGISRMAGAAPATSRSSSSTCSAALLSSDGVRKRSSTFRSFAACSMPLRMVETAPSPSRRITDISSRAGRWCFSPGAKAKSQNSTLSPTRGRVSCNNTFRFTAPPPSDTSGRPLPPGRADRCAQWSRCPVRCGW